ncbi:MAG TPA: ATP-binding protein [Actinomycetota bacterium]|nr:ATP-binding protein [Actinomycetota bacterium]
MSAEVEPQGEHVDGAYLAALHETALGLSEQVGADGLLERLVTWAGQVVGTPHGYICLIEPGAREMVLRVGTGAYADLVGLRMLKGEGLSGQVWETGAPLAIPDYSRWEGRVQRFADDVFRAVLGVPLSSGGMVTGVIGLSRTEPGRTFDADEVDQVSRFAELASIALDNARLYAATQQELAERRRAEEQLRAAERRFRTLVEQLPALVYSEEFDEDGRMYISPQIKPMFGFTPEEVRDKRLWKDRLHPEDRERVLAEDARTDATGEPFRIEYRTLHKDGHPIWVRDEAVLVHDDDGTPLFWQGIIVDITESKRALEREREVAQRLRALDKMKNTFLDAVSHELRTPLAAIVGIGITLEQKGDILAKQDRDDLYTRLVVNARKLNRLLDDLLDLDRLTHGIVTPRRRPTDVAALAKRIAEDWGLLSDRQPQVVAEPVTVSVDQAKVERIVENLLANAARHTPAETPVWVRVERARGGDGVLIAVEDAGAGIPEELRDSVFEPFRQGPDAPPYAPGVGIGLTLVARFAELHGGRAWVEERPGGGSSFRVLIPDAPQER